MGPRVAIVVPVHNVEAYLVPCLESVRAQTVREIEIICVDDASTDRSAEILTQQAALDPRIRVVRHERNLGLSGARNTGLKEVRAPWVLFIDSDDLVASRLCEHCLKAAEALSADVVFFGHLPFEDGDVSPAEASAAKPVPADRAALLLRQSFAWTKLASTEFLRRRGIEYPLGLCLQDVPVHWRLVLESESPVFLDEPLVWYRQRASSISYRSNWTRADGFIVHDIVRDYLRRTQQWERWHARFMQRELSIFADIHFNFVNTNSSLVPRAQAEVMKRMTVEHWNMLLVDDTIPRDKRDYLLACCRPPTVSRSLQQALPSIRYYLRRALRQPWRALKRKLGA